MTRVQQFRDYAESIGAGRLEWIGDDDLAERLLWIDFGERISSAFSSAFVSFEEAVLNLGRALAGRVIEMAEPSIGSTRRLPCGCVEEYAETHEPPRGMRGWGRVRSCAGHRWRQLAVLAAAAAVVGLLLWRLL